MNNKGKQKLVLFEETMKIDNVTGERTKSDNSFILWMDEYHRVILDGIEGIIKIFDRFEDLGNKYLVITDPRYDINFIKAEIEGQIKVIED